MARAIRRGKETQNLSDLAQQKAALRAQVRAELARMSAEEQAVASQQACGLLEQQPVYRSARSILFYAPLPGELDIWPALLKALAAGKSVLLPRFIVEHGHYVASPILDVIRDVQPGPYGIREPLATSEKFSLNQLDLILVPGIAFDPTGRRLGRGKGYYDRWLAGFEGMTCGVAFDQQIVAHLPVAAHDVHLSCLLTPTRWLGDTGPRAVLK